MNASTLLNVVRRPGRATRLVPRRALVFLRLDLPDVSRGQLTAAVRLQLTQYMPADLFGFICHRPSGGHQALVWAWVIGDDAPSPRRGGGWAESALDEPAAGLRLVRRSEGLEAQQWRGAELVHTRWFATIPTAAEWQQFVRGCGADPLQHPLPEACVARTLKHPRRGWLAGDSRPVSAPVLGLRWYVGLLVLGAAAAAALGAHIQARQQLQRDNLRLQALRVEREASLQARAHYEQAARDLERLQVLAPRLSQLELLYRVSQSGIFVRPTPPTAAPAATSGAPVAVPTALSASPAAVPVRLVDWDVRGGQLKMTLELPERDVALLDITRRLEAVPGLGALRVGQEGSGNTLTISASVADLVPISSTESSRPSGPGVLK